MSEFNAFNRESGISEQLYVNVGPNLALLCTYYNSIAEVCRLIGINRQQFNKYLNGSAYPSRKNLSRICNFFGVTEAEILFDQQSFSNLISLRREVLGGGFLDPLLSRLVSLFERCENIDRYQGYFFRYFPSYAVPNKFVKALGYIGKAGDLYYWKSNESLIVKEENVSYGFGKWRGIFLKFSDRLYLVEYDSANVTTPVASSIFYPCYRARVDYILGVQNGMPLRKGRQIRASRVVLEYLGAEVDVKSVMRQCGLFGAGDAELPTYVLELLDSKTAPGTLILDVNEP